jgi:hypothetical protein
VLCGTVGFLCGLRVKPLLHKEKPKTEPTQAQIRAAQKAAREYSNFLNYDGSVQDDFNA